MPKVMIEVDIPDGWKIPQSEDVKRLVDPDWMAEWWHIDDVIEQAENSGEQLTEDEAREVLMWMNKWHDCNNGHTWDSMDRCIDNVVQQREEA